MVQDEPGRCRVEGRPGDAVLLDQREEPFGVECPEEHYLRCPDVEVKDRES
jgi:hypothetical protein